MELENAELRFKRFLHYGSEERLYLPNGNLRYTFSPEKVKSIEELLRDDATANTLVDTITRVNQCDTSIAPCALLYALAMIVRKAKKNMTKADQKQTADSSAVDEASKAIEPGPSVVKKTDESDSTNMEVETKPKQLHRLRRSAKNKVKGDPDDPSQPNTRVYAQKPSDLVIRDAYRAARKLSEDCAENLLLFTHYLREIAISEGKKGFGIGWRITIDNWYEYQSPEKLCRSVTKFYEGLTWTHSDLLTLIRWNSGSYTTEIEQVRDAIMLFSRFSYNSAHSKYSNNSFKLMKTTLKYLKQIHDLRRARNEEQALQIVSNKNIKFDVVPPVLLKTSHKIWLQLIPRMSPEQLLPLINRLSRLKMFKYPEIVAEVVKKFDEEIQASTHPMQVFITRKRYEEAPNLAVEFQYIRRRQEIEMAQQRGEVDEAHAREVRNVDEVRRIPAPRRNAEIIRSLNNVFNKTISSLAATGKSFLIAVDGQAATASRRCLYERFVTIEEAALLVALCVIKAEVAGAVKLVTFVKEPFFFREIPVNKNEETVDSLKSKIFKDDCVNGNVAALIKYALINDEKYDVFIVLSDNFVLPGPLYEDLKGYREEVNSKAKVVVCSFIGRHKKHAELTKPGMLLICGLDKHVPKLIESYSRESFE